MEYIAHSSLVEEFGTDRVVVFEPQPDLLPLGNALTPQVKLALESTMSPTRKPHIPARHLEHIRRLSGIGFTLSTHTVMDCDVSALLCERLLYLLGMSSASRGMLRTVLHETLLNGAIHGNMGISSPKLTTMDDYSAMHAAVAEKRSDAEAMQRLITTVFAPDDGMVRFIVCDEGAGFDTGRLYADLQNSAETKANGRGLKMVQGMTTTLKFHDDGAAVEFTVGK